MSSTPLRLARSNSLSSPDLSPISQESGESDLLSDPFESPDQSMSRMNVARNLSFGSVSDTSSSELIHDFQISVRDENGISWGFSADDDWPVLIIKERYAEEKNETRASLDTEFYVAKHTYPLDDKEVKQEEYPLGNDTEIGSVFKRLGLTSQSVLQLNAKTVPFKGPYYVTVRPFWGWASVSGLTYKYSQPFLDFYTRKPMSIGEIMKKVENSKDNPFHDKGRTMQLFGTEIVDDHLHMTGAPLSKTDTLNDVNAEAMPWTKEAEAAMYPSGRIDPSLKKNPRLGLVDLVVALKEYPNRWCSSRSGDSSYDWDGEMPPLASAAGGGRARKVRNTKRTKTTRKKGRKTRKSK